MSHRAAFAFAVSLLALSSAAAVAGEPQSQPDAVLLRMPDVSRENIAFRYAGDVWIVDKKGGVARPLTSSAGNESFPKFSPDGKQLAFMGGYDGGSDLYVLALDGGLPARITHHPANEILCDWHPDGKELVFYSPQISGQARAPRVFTVSAMGGQPQPLAIPYGTFGAIDETGAWLAYTPLTQSEFRTWKRYQGGMAQDIWLFNLKTNESKRVTDYPGTDSLPMWHGREILFLSDRGKNGKLNLWSYDTQKSTTTQLTDFADFDVRFPSIGPEDVVFENGGKLQRYEFSSKKSVPVEIMIPRDRPKLRAQTVDVGDLVQGVSVGPNAKRVAFEARGEVFSVPVEKGVTRNLTHTDGIAERSPEWSPDGEWVAYFSDRSGEYELCLRRADGKSFRWKGAGEDDVEEHRLSDLGPGWKFSPYWSPDSKKIAFCTDDGVLHLTDVDSGATAAIDENPDGFPFDVKWSPDSRWIAFDHRGTHSRLSAIFVYDTTDKTKHELTSGQFNDVSPAFEKGGDWLFYLSDRTFDPIYSDFDDTWIYTNARMLLAVPLRKDVKNPWAPESAEEGDEESEKKDDAKDEKEKEEKKDGDAVAKADGEKKDEDEKADGDKEKKDEAPKPVAIELDGFEARAILLPVDAGPLGALAGAKGKAIYIRRPRTGAGDDEKPKLVYFDLAEKKEKERKEQTILSGVDGFQIAGKADKLLVALSDDKGFAIVDIGKDQKAEETIDLSGLSTTVDPRHEWDQILSDASRLVRDMFYEPTLHGNDWKGIVARYRRALADATSRDDLHYLIAELISELNVGHAYINGPPSGLESAGPARKVGLLGCDWKFENGAFRIARILGGSAAEVDARSPLAVPGIDAHEGDYLLAVNGTPLNTASDVYAAFDGLAGRATELVLNASPTLDGKERRVIVKPIESEGALRYRDWVAHNAKVVDEMSNGRVGYVHVPDTGVNGQNELVRQFMSQFQKDALLVDERWNGGGQIPTRFIELLDRPVTNYWAVRHGEDWTWPQVGHRGPKAMLINGSSGSGGDAFPYYFRQSGLGKLIGMRTWGGLVGLSGNPGFIDGSSITVPRFAFYENDGTWGVEGYGVAPDIEVIDDPAKMVNGDDPQLIAGVKQLMSELGSYKPQRPKRPASPDRHGTGLRPEDR